MITNGGQGILLTYYADSDIHFNVAVPVDGNRVARQSQAIRTGAGSLRHGGGGSARTPNAASSATGRVPQVLEAGMAITNGTSVTLVSGPAVSDQSGPLFPILQAQDGSFVGTVGTGPNPGNTTQTNMVVFDATGTVRWTVPGYNPKIATADGGVIATDESGAATTFDRNGAAVEQFGSLPTYSWLGYSYQIGSIDQIALSSVLDFASSFWAFEQGSPTGNRTAVKLVQNKWFIPNKINEDPRAVNAFYDALRGNIKPPKVAFDLLVKEKATETAFLKALDTTNMIVAYLGHGVMFSGGSGAGALCFGGGETRCLAPDALSPTKLSSLPSGATGWYSDQTGQYYDLLANGFNPKAKIVFLGACFIDSAFTDQWHPDSSRALIVPVYSTQSEFGNIDLTFAAWEIQSMVMTLADGKDVNAAIAEGNHTAAFQGAHHRWKVVPQEAGNVKIR